MIYLSAKPLTFRPLFRQVNSQKLQVQTPKATDEGPLLK